MAYFEYRALHPDGRQDNGTLETDSMEQAAANLRQRGLMVVSLQETANPENIGSVTKRRWIHRAAWLLPILARDRATFFRQMSMTLHSSAFTNVLSRKKKIIVNKTKDLRNV